MLADFEREPLYRVRRIPETSLLNRILVKLHLKRPNTEIVWPDIGRVHTFERDSS